MGAQPSKEGWTTEPGGDSSGEIGEHVADAVAHPARSEALVKLVEHPGEADPAGDQDKDESIPGRSFPAEECAAEKSPAKAEKEKVENLVAALRRTLGEAGHGARKPEEQGEPEDEESPPEAVSEKKGSHERIGGDACLCS